MIAGLVAVGAAPLATAGPASAAGKGLHAPVGLPRAIEGLPKYDPATSCSPTVKPGARKLMNLLLRTYSTSRSLGISRACGSGGRSEHKEGRALDWGNRAWVASERRNVAQFVSWAFAADSNGNRYAGARRLGIMYMIWSDHIWSADNPSAGWQPYLHPACKSVRTCDTTLRHRDHLHISLSWAGARGQTSFWTGHVGGGGGSIGTASRHSALPRSKQINTYKKYVLRKGMHGNAVVALQKALRMPEITGYYGVRTRRTVIAFQKGSRLPRTGVVATRTWAKLRSDIGADAGRISRVRHTTLKKGAHGRAVVVLQRALNIRLDRRYGSVEKTRVRIFQRYHGIPMTGVVGPRTWSALRGI